MTMRKKIARAMCRARGKDPDTVNTQGVVRWTLYLLETDAALKALAEPSEEMISEALWAEDEVPYGQSKRMYIAMIQAAKEGK